MSRMRGWYQTEGAQEFRTLCGIHLPQVSEKTVRGSYEIETHKLFNVFEILDHTGHEWRMLDGPS